MAALDSYNSSTYELVIARLYKLYLSLLFNLLPSSTYDGPHVWLWD